MSDFWLIFSTRFTFQIGLGVFVARAGPSNRIMLHQAANDGVRGLYMLCFEGVDAGKGFVVLSNGDNPAVLFQCELTRHLLGPQGEPFSRCELVSGLTIPAGLDFQGIDFAQYGDLSFDMSTFRQETIVNMGERGRTVPAVITVDVTTTIAASALCSAHSHCVAAGLKSLVMDAFVDPEDPHKHRKTAVPENKKSVWSWFSRL